jgi:hypothetical protein
LACRDLLHETVVSGRTPVADKEEALAVPEFIRTRSSYETLDLKVTAIVDAYVYFLLLPLTSPFIVADRRSSPHAHMLK